MSNPDGQRESEDKGLHLLEARLTSLEESVTGAVSRMAADLTNLRDILQLLYDQEPENRLRLQALRRSDVYREAFEEEEPLVSVVIPTFEGLDKLESVALPSVLGQDYRNLEILIVIDGSPIRDSIYALARKLGDSRIRVLEQEHNGPYPRDPRLKWLVTASPPVNLGVGEATGRWISLLSEDDRLRPVAIRTLVQEAQMRRLEVVYGQLLMHHKDGRQEPICEFPPRLHRFGWQGAIYHAGLGFMQHELADALFDQPSDWSLMRRMLRIGVRVGMIDEELADYFPSYRGS